jgi:flagellin-like protein
MRTRLGVRAISPLVATLILIAATVAGGALVYAVMRSQMSSLAGAADLQVNYAEIIVAGGVSKAFVTVQNTGNVKLSGVGVKITQEAGSEVTINLGDIDKGQTKSGETSGNWTAGKSYILTVRDNNDLVVKSLSVVAHS